MMNIDEHKSWHTSANSETNIEAVGSSGKNLRDKDTAFVTDTSDFNF